MLIGLKSNGLHTNGYSLARKVLLEKYNINTKLNDFNESLGDVLLSIHKSYLGTISPLINETWLHGLSHVTGGGIEENTYRILEDNQKIKINWDSWDVPLIFDLIKKTGSVPEHDMRRTFNMGIGMILIIDKNNVDDAIDSLNKTEEKFFILGEIV